MATPKQIAANRRNAQKSTGPRTPHGKSIARFNAVKHALTGQLNFIPACEHAAYIAVTQPLSASLNPMGAQELQLAERIVKDTWRLHRAAANEDNMYALGLLDPFHNNESALVLNDESADPCSPMAVAISNTRTFFNHTRDFDRASLYEQRLNRALHKNYALFRKLQSERNREETKSVARTGRVWQRPEPFVDDAPNGFVLSTSYKVPFNRPIDRHIAPQIVNSTHHYITFRLR